MKKLTILIKYIFLCTIISTGVFSCSEDNDDVIVPVSPTDISIAQVSSTLNIGNTKQLVATVLPEETTDKSVTWLSSDAEIATVDANGLVTCLSNGDFVIQATTNNNIKATVDLSVVRPDFVVPEELVGHWVIDYFYFKEKGCSKIFDKEMIRQEFISFYGMSNEEVDSLFAFLSTSSSYIVNEDATMVWYLSYMLEDNVITSTVMNGVLSDMDNIDNTYIGTFDTESFQREYDVSKQDYVFENSRVRSVMPWNQFYDAIVYYRIDKSSSYKSNSLTNK